MEMIIRKGATKRLATRWEQPLIKYAQITAISRAAPMRITVNDHGLADGWRFCVTGIKGGGSVLNAKANPPKPNDYMKAIVIDKDTIEVNKVNSSNFPAYGGGGVLQYNAPIDLSLCTARAQVREKLTSTTALIELTTENGGIVIDVEKAMVTVIFTAEITAQITAKKGVFDLEIVMPDGTVMAYPQTLIKFEGEVTR
jgi:hypothetical protein